MPTPTGAASAVASSRSSMLRLPPLFLLPLGLAVACGDAAWDRRLIASTCRIACVGAAEDPLLRLAALELIQGLSK